MACAARVKEAGMTKTENRLQADRRVMGDGTGGGDGTCR